MTLPIDYQSPLKHQRPSRFPIVLAVVALLIGLGVLLFRPLLGLLLAFALSGTSKPVAPAEAARSVAVSLMRWGVFGAVPDRDPDYTNLKNSISRRITGLNGFTESDGFHGDGTDWYEVELSPDLATELRSALARSPTVMKGEFPQKWDSAPSWWPKSWPSDAQCYRWHFEYLVLPDSGTRAWFLRVRT